MPWYVYLFIAYIVIDRISNIALIGRSYEITPSLSILALMIGALQVWALLSLV